MASYSGTVKQQNETVYFDEHTQSTKTAATAEDVSEASKTQQLAEQVSRTSTLDAETQKLVKDLISGLSTGLVDTEDALLGDLAKNIFERSQDAQADVTKQIADITGAARFEGEQQLKQLETQLAQQSGGSVANTLVASSTAVGRANLEAQLAKTKGELTLAGRQQITQELASSVQSIGEAQGKPVENITNLLNVLKGADVQQRTETEQASTTESTLARILDTITKERTAKQSQERRAKTSGSFTYGGANI